MAIFRDPEIVYIIRRTCCTSQGDPDSSFPCGPPMSSKFPDQHKQEKPTQVFVPETPVDSCSSLVRPNFNLSQSLNFETGTNAVHHFVDTDIQSNVHTSQSPSKIIDRCTNEIHSDLIASTPNDLTMIRLWLTSLKLKM